jgi:TetR/AcrR family transcriptional repressor of nem operon
MAYLVSADRQRGRPREFDVDLAVERAMQVFWSEGYRGTSLPNLLAATELSRGSLYAAFGDKHGIFLRALERYIDQALTRLDQELSPSRNALAGLRACMNGYLTRTDGAAGKRGCLVVATAMELAAHDREVADRIGRFFKAMEARLTATLVRAQAEGDVVGNIDPEAAAHMLVCLLEGMRVIRKTGSERRKSSAAIQTFIDRIAS